MRKLFKIILIAIPLSLISCNNDDDNQNQSNNLEKDIIGKWIPYEISVNNNIKKYDDHEPCGLDYLQFNNDFSYKYIDVFDCKEEIEEGSYSIESKNNKLIIKNGFINREGYIRIYNSPQKVLSIEFTYDYDDDGKDDSVVTYYNFSN